MTSTDVQEGLGIPRERTTRPRKVCPQKEFFQHKDKWTIKVFTYSAMEFYVSVILSLKNLFKQELQIVKHGLFKKIFKASVKYL